MIVSAGIIGALLDRIALAPGLHAPHRPGSLCVIASQFAQLRFNACSFGDFAHELNQSRTFAVIFPVR